MQLPTLCLYCQATGECVLQGGKATGLSQQPHPSCLWSVMGWLLVTVLLSEHVYKTFFSPRTEVSQTGFQRC